MVVYMLSLLEAPDSFLVLNSVNNGNLFSKTSIFILLLSN